MRGGATAILALAVACSGCTCSKNTPGEADATPAAENLKPIAEPVGLSAPIAATHVDGGDVVVAGLDVPARGIRLQRIRGNDEVVVDRIVLDDVKWSSDCELKLAATGTGVVVTWSGLRAGKLARLMVVLGRDLTPTGPPVTIAAASCVTHDAMWVADAKGARSIPLVKGVSEAGARAATAMPSEVETSIVCGPRAAFALLEGEDSTSAVPLGVSDKPIRLFRESEDDESKERSEYIDGDTLGIVRLASSGALTTRELRDGGATPLRKLETKIPQDDDIVAVDASPRLLAVAFTSDASEACKGEGHATKIRAVRIDRTSQEEATLVLSEGTCGRETGPFFTSAQGDDVMVAWVERASTEKGARPPVSGLAYARVTLAGSAPAVTGKIEQEADALVDAGCDKTTCYAVALARQPSNDAMIPGVARVLRYPAR